jgi:hypothetical protein
MPPWYADTNYSRFGNEHILNKYEKESLLKWLKKPEINYSEPENTDIILPKPDLVLPIANGFTLTGDSKDHFVIFKIPYEIPTDTLVSCIQFVSKSSSPINHHLNFEIIALQSGTKFDTNNVYFEVPKDGYNRANIYNLLGLTDTTGNAADFLFYGSWVPGMSPTIFKKPFSVFLPKQGYIVARIMHYAPSPIDIVDSCYFNIYFNKSKKDPDYRRIYVWRTGSGATDITPPFVIEPNEKKWFYSTSTIKNDIIAYSINPHMHMLGKKFIAYATYGNDTLPLIKIDNWNFEFQENYVFKNPVVFKEGTKIHIAGYYDNTSDNILNPNLPPKRVTGEEGMLTSGEMLLLPMLYINSNKSDEKFIKDVE